MERGGSREWTDAEEVYLQKTGRGRANPQHGSGLTWTRAKGALTLADVSAHVGFSLRAHFASQSGPGCGHMGGEEMKWETGALA